MCLTIPKKVVSVEGRTAVLENLDGTRQDFSAVIDLAVGDFVLTQQNFIVEKITEEEYDEFLAILKGGRV